MKAPSAEQPRREMTQGVEGAPAGSVQGPVLHPLVSFVARRAVLEPHRLAATTEKAARALLRQGEATNTRLSYSSATRYWCAWFAARYGQALSLPVPVPVVVQFIVDHAARRPDAGPAEDASSAGGQQEQGGDPEGDGQPAEAAVAAPKPNRLQKGRVLTDVITELPPDVDEALVAGGYKGKAGPPALATLVHRIAVLSKAHQMAQAGRAGHSGIEDVLGASRAGIGGLEGVAPGQPAGNRTRGAEAGLVNPCADPLVRELLARTRRAYAQRGVRPQKQRALTRDPLQQILATCDDSPKGIRDRALLLFAWSTGGRRRSEVALARIEHLQKVEERPKRGTRLSLRFRRTRVGRASRSDLDTAWQLAGLRAGRAA